MDPVLLACGIVRVAIWYFAAGLAWRSRRAVPTLGFSLAGTFASVFAVSNAGGEVPAWAFAVSAFGATPTAALLAAAYYLRTPPGFVAPYRWRL